VAEGQRTAAELARACGASPRGVRILADYFTVIGFLRKHDDHYELTPESQVFLNRRSPAYLGGTVDFLLTAELRACFQGLAAAVRRGGDGGLRGGDGLPR
jgi:hypothetical protein